MFIIGAPMGTRYPARTFVRPCGQEFRGAGQEATIVGEIPGEFHLLNMRVYSERRGHCHAKRFVPLRIFPPSG